MKDFKKSIRPSRKPFGDRPVERFQATCNECHKKCEVPFRPNGKKPVYCRDCFKGKEEQPAYGRTSRSNEMIDSGGMKRELSVLNTKIDRLIEVIEAQTRQLSKSK